MGHLSTLCSVCIQHECSKETPLFLLHGREAILPTDIQLQVDTIDNDSSDINAYKQYLLHGFQDVLQLVRTRLDKQHQSQENRYNLDHQANPFTVGGSVWLWTPKSKKRTI